MLGALIAAEVMPVLDRKGAAASLPSTLGMSSDVAQWFLTAVAGAMITTAGVVSRQLASGQFSPRVMRAFIRDRLSQIVVGLLVATFVYCIVLLRYTGASPAEPAPRLSLTLALVLTVATVFLIIAHLDHLTRGCRSVMYCVKSPPKAARSSIRRSSAYPMSTFPAKFRC